MPRLTHALLIALTTALVIAMGMAMGAVGYAATHPTTVVGMASPIPGAFLSTGQAPAAPYVPLTLPLWAEPVSPWGALPVDIRPWEVRYADGSVLWLDDNGVPWWDVCAVPGEATPDCPPLDSI